MSFLFMSDVLDWFSEGEVLRRIFSVLLKAASILLLLGALYQFIRNWALVTELGFGGFIGLLWVQLIFIIATYMILHTIWIRSNEIAGIDPGAYTVIPIFSQLSRLLGELYAIAAINVGIGGAVILLFARIPWELQQIISSFTPDFFPELGYGAGAGAGIAIRFLFATLGAGLAALVTFFLLAELLIVLVDIARNTAK